MPICEEKDEEDALPKDHIFFKFGERSGIELGTCFMAHSS